jgi:hypothetical protein
MTSRLTSILSDCAFLVLGHRVFWDEACRGPNERTAYEYERMNEGDDEYDNGDPIPNFLRS